MSFRNLRRAKRFLQLSIAARVLGTAAAMLGGYANAQSTGGRIRGTVTDTSGAAITGATVTLLNEANGTTRDTQSGSNGEYGILEVPVGVYTVVSQQNGRK